jgi:RimJ/RimL family protein N-acetyltransferase
MEKLGMARANELDFNDPAMPPAYNPTIQYAITREQWEALR